MEQIKKISNINYEQEQEKVNSKSSKKNLLKDNSSFERDLIEKYFIEKFFETITSTVEIRTNEGIKNYYIYKITNNAIAITKYKT